MKKNILIVFGCAVLLMFSASAVSAQGMYFSGNLGAAMLSDTDMQIPGMAEDIEDLEQFIIEMMGFDDFDLDVGYKLKSKTGVALGVAMGYDFAGGFRLEGELAYQKNDIDKAVYSEHATITYMGTTDSSTYSTEDDASGDSSSLALLANVYYDFKNASRVTPFVTAGIGYAKVDVSLSSAFLGAEDESEDDAVFAFQMGVGCGYAVSETLTLDLKYRYFATQDPDLDGVKVEYSSNNVYFGVRIGF